MSDYHGRFGALLKQEATTLEELYEVLMKELVALKDRDSDSVNTLSKEKESILDKLEKLDKERQLCIESESPENKSTISNEIDSLSSEIQICLDKCKQQNNINGGIIEMSQLFNEKMLDIICGNFEKQTTYSASGKNSKASNQHSLGRA